MHVISRFKGVSNIKKYSRALYKTRFQDLYPENGIFLQRNKLLTRQHTVINDGVDRSVEESPSVVGFNCFREETSLLNLMGERSEFASFLSHLLFSDVRIDKLQIVGAAQYIASHANNPAVPSGAKWLWAGDYVEQIARWAMNDPEKVVLFIRECLNIDSKVDTSVSVCVLIVNKWLSYLLSPLVGGYCRRPFGDEVGTRALQGCG